MKKPLLEPFGTHKQIAIWLEQGKYRSLIHRHDGTFVAADESVNLLMKSDTIPLLADALMNWPDGARPMPPAAYVRVCPSK